MKALNGNTGGPHAEAFKKIVAPVDGDARRRERSEPTSLTSRADAPQLPAGDAAAAQDHQSREGTYGYAKGQALMHLTQQKGKEELPFLKKLVEQRHPGADRLVRPERQPGPIQHQCLLKDVAFAYIVTLHGHKMTDFGFKFPPGPVPQPESDRLRQLCVRDRRRSSARNGEVGHRARQ